MKPGNLIIGLLFIAPLVIIVAGYLSFRYDQSCDLKVLDSVSLRDGDLVFRKGISVESYTVVISGTGNTYSHIGLIIMKGGKPFVIHIEPGKASMKNDIVKKEPLNSFLGPDKASHFAIYRSNLEGEKLRKVISQANEFYNNRCRFDNFYDLGEDRFLYCTELVLKAFSKGDPQINRLALKLQPVNILVSSHKILMPGTFISSNFFYRVINQ